MPSGYQILSWLSKDKYHQNGLLVEMTMITRDLSASGDFYHTLLDMQIINTGETSLLLVSPNYPNILLKKPENESFEMLQKIINEMRFVFWVEDIEKTWEIWKNQAVQAVSDLIQEKEIKFFTARDPSGYKIKIFSF